MLIKEERLHARGLIIGKLCLILGRLQARCLINSISIGKILYYR